MRRTASGLQSPCAPGSTASWRHEKRRCGSCFPFPPSPQRTAGCAAPSFSYCPTQLPCEGRGTAQEAPTGHNAACRRGHAGSITSVSPPPPPMLLSLGENGDTTAAKCADLSSRSGRRGPLPGARRPRRERRCRHCAAGLDASTYSFRFNEGAFLRGEIFTFSFPGGHLRPDDTQTGSPPLPFPIPISLEGWGRRGARGGRGLQREQNRAGNKMLINQPRQPCSPPLCGVNGKCHFTC